MKKRIISFCLYGDHPTYLQGALENAALAPTIYPGWTSRFYVSQEIPASMVRQLEDAGAEVLRRKRRHEADGLFWRFFPAAETEVEATIIRDVDSRLSDRERLAVEEWLASGRTFHIMRDHPCHRNLVMGGMWGCRGGALRDLRRLEWTWRLRRWRQGLPAFDQYGLDQLFLSEMVYPRILHDACIHTDWVRFAGETVRPFPSGRTSSGYVGERIGGDGAPLDHFPPPQEPEMVVLALSEFAPGVR